MTLPKASKVTLTKENIEWLHNMRGTSNMKIGILVNALVTVARENPQVLLDYYPKR